MKRATICLFISFIICFAACENNISIPDESITKKDTQMEIAKEIEMLYSDSSRVRVRIKGPTLLNHVDRSNPRKEFPDGIKVDFFNQSHQVSSKLTAKYAIQIAFKNVIIVRDSVVVYSPNNEKLETEELVWDELKEEVHTNRRIKITTPTEIIEGYGFKSDQNFTNWEIKKVTGKVAADNFKTNF